MFKTVPICDECWNKHWPRRRPFRLKHPTKEVCDLCDRETRSGIYGRRDTSIPKLKMGEDHDMPPSACLDCGHVMAFDDELKLRELNAQEAYEIAGDKRILAIQATRAKVMKEHKT